MWEGIKKTFSDPKELKAAFVSEKKTILQKLRAHQWQSSAELEELLGKLGQIELANRRSRTQQQNHCLFEGKTRQSPALFIAARCPAERRSARPVAQAVGEPERRILQKRGAGSAAQS
jgi:hypothetical protein